MNDVQYFNWGPLGMRQAPREHFGTQQFVRADDHDRAVERPCGVSRQTVDATLSLLRHEPGGYPTVAYVIEELAKAAGVKPR